MAWVALGLGRRLGGLYGRRTGDDGMDALVHVQVSFCGPGCGRRSSVNGAAASGNPDGWGHRVPRLESSQLRGVGQGPVLV